MIEYQQQLHSAADREAIHGGDPRFRDRKRLPARAVLDQDPPQQLVNVAQFAAQQEIHQRDAAGVQFLEVYPGAEHPLAPVAGMAHLPAAQQADIDARVEQRQVHGGLHVVDLPVILRVEAIVAAHGQPRRAIHPLNAHRAQVSDPGPGEFRQQAQRPGSRPQHGAEQVRPGCRRAQHPAQEDALVDLPAFLACLRPRPLGRHLAGRGHQARKGGSGSRHQLRQPQITGAAVGDLVVDRLGVGVHEQAADRPRAIVGRRGARLLLRRPLPRLR